jgi:hypothetical protein
MQPGAIGHHRVDERLDHVDPPSRRAQHPLDQVGQLPRRQDRRRQLAAPPAGDEDPPRLVDPNRSKLSDSWVLQEVRQSEDNAATRPRPWIELDPRYGIGLGPRYGIESLAGN